MCIYPRIYVRVYAYNEKWVVGEWGVWIPFKIYVYRAEYDSVLVVQLTLEWRDERALFMAMSPPVTSRHKLTRLKPRRMLTRAHSISPILSPSHSLSPLWPIIFLSVATIIQPFCREIYQRCGFFPFIHLYLSQKIFFILSLFVFFFFFYFVNYISVNCRLGIY